MNQVTSIDLCFRKLTFLESENQILEEIFLFLDSLRAWAKERVNVIRSKKSHTLSGKGREGLV